MLIVTIQVNEKVIHRITAQRREWVAGKINSYAISDGRVIKHQYAKGAVKLALKMLDGYSG